jgi:EAL domain-containing protein (putative c-di-GMP-specific phosphodiesterase class I)
MFECLARFNFGGRVFSPSDFELHFNDKEFLWQLFESSIPSLISHTKRDFEICVNIDVNTLTEQFFSIVESLALDYMQITKSIHFEITEKHILGGLDTLPYSIDRLRSIGHKIILDDFGTGGANLECLEHIKFDLIKIDGQFLSGATKGIDGLNKLKHIVGLLQCYKTDIVAEHIENEETAKIAENLNICYGQGYLFGMPAHAIG